MIDINLIRNNPTFVKTALKKRDYDFDAKSFLSLDTTRREKLARVESLRAQINRVSALVPALKKDKKDTSKIFAEMKELGEEIEVLQNEIKVCEEKINDILYAIPNIPDDDVVGGGKENNKVIKTFNKQPKFKFTPKSHIELCQLLGLIDYERAAKISGSGAWIYTGLGARLEWALLNYFIDEHINDGYNFMLLPHMLNYECGFGAGQFPKFADDVYWIDGKEKGNKFLLPTAETALVNVHRNEILKEQELPKKYFGYTPCYRREAGSYRAEERGMIRGHQFNKVEMVQYTTAQNSSQAFYELVKKAETLVEKLGLHFQTSKLAAGDCSSGMARTYDIEVWIPSMGIYKEVSSVSNAKDFQARRSNTRYRNESGKVEFVHTLNASGLATSRLFPSILEQFQNADGSVTIPLVLRPYLGGLEVIKPVEN